MSPLGGLGRFKGTKPTLFVSAITKYNLGGASIPFVSPENYHPTLILHS